jgi:hypothetical protein
VVEDSIGGGLIFGIPKGFWETRPLPHRISAYLGGFTGTIEISATIDFFLIYNHPPYNLNISTPTCLTPIETLRNAS